MELNKRKYKREEVYDIVNDALKSADEKLSEQKLRIVELLEENEALNAEISKLKSREELVEITLVNAQKNAKEESDKLKLNYELTVERLKKFSKKWTEYFNELKDKYPLYNSTLQAIEVYELLCKALKIKNKETAVDLLDKKINETSKVSAVFNPKQKIQDYVSATSENGFNLDDVLNPGELHLEDICKELGLLED